MELAYAVSINVDERVRLCSFHHSAFKIFYKSKEKKRIGRYIKLTREKIIIKNS